MANRTLTLDHLQTSLREGGIDREVRPTGRIHNGYLHQPLETIPPTIISLLSHIMTPPTFSIPEIIGSFKFVLTFFFCFPHVCLFYGPLDQA